MKCTRWIVDGDIGIELFGILNLIKYKDSTVFSWGWRKYSQAPKRFR